MTILNCKYSTTLSETLYAVGDALTQHPAGPHFVHDPLYLCNLPFIITNKLIDITV